MVTAVETKNMSLLVALPGVDARTLASNPLARAAGDVARDQGHGQPELMTWQGGCAWWFDTPDNPGVGGACVREGDRFAACVGTPVWDDSTGSELLRKWLARFDGPASLPWLDTAGSFALLIGGPQGVWLANDAIGLQKIYRRRDGAMYSSSLLAVRGSIAQPRVRRLRAQEYVLLESNHGLETPLAEVDIADPTLVTRLDTGRHERVVPASAWRSEQTHTSLQAACEDLAPRIGASMGSLVRAHDGPVGMALSGGFDSRLLLAALDHIDTTPSLFVYGRSSDDDVQVAVKKASELGLAIDAIDKSLIDAEQPPLDAAAVRASIAFFDGLPVDGAMDRGSDRLTRQRQMAGGCLNLNGGGGEILRNFFYLPDRSYSASDLARTFYGNWLPAAVPDPDERRALLDAIADTILSALDVDAAGPASRTRALARDEIERAYALVRLRFWMGRNNSIGAQHGAFVTPLVHPRLIADAAALPLAWKTYGDLESAIIQRLSPRVASGPSKYGFSFSDGPSGAYRRQLLTTLLRPVAIRQRSARIRHRLGRLPVMPAPREWQELMPSPLPDWIDPRGLTSRAQWNRLFTLMALLDATWDPAP